MKDSSSIHQAFSARCSNIREVIVEEIMDAWILVKRDEKPKAAWHWIISCFLVAYIIAMNSWLSHTFSVFMSVLFCYISMMEIMSMICSVLDYCIKLALQLLEGCSFNRICPWFPTGELKRTENMTNYKMSKLLLLWPKHSVTLVQMFAYMWGFLICQGVFQDYL